VPLSNEEASALFRDFTRSAFRLETLQVYLVAREQPSLEKFLAGQPKPADHNAGFREAEHGGREDHAESQGSRAAAERISPLPVRLGHSRQCRGGEDYRIVDLTDRTLDLPARDFWLFDEHTVLVLNFNPDGTLRDRDLADSSELDKYLRWRDLALSEAVPFREYRA
jgi:hypothetical protein